MRTIKKAYTLEKAISDYSAEVEYFKEAKANGIKSVKENAAGEDLAAGREVVDIDEVIKYWKTKLEELKSGNVNPEDYNY